MAIKRPTCIMLLFYLGIVWCCPNKKRCTKCSETLYPPSCQECSYSYFDYGTWTCETKDLPSIEYCLNFIKADGKIKCAKCDLGFTLNVMGRCEKCMVIGCAACDSETQSCHACFNRILPSWKSNSCDGPDKCSSKNCDICELTRHSDDCLVCKNGYALASETMRKCVRSTFNCLIADPDDFGRCKVCQSGYFIAQNGTCPADDSNGLSLSFVICLIIAVCALVFAFTQTFQKIEGPPEDGIITFA